MRGAGPGGPGRGAAPSRREGPRGRRGARGRRMEGAPCPLPPTEVTPKQQLALPHPPKARFLGGPKVRPVAGNPPGGHRDPLPWARQVGTTKGGGFASGETGRASLYPLCVYQLSKWVTNSTATLREQTRVPTSPAPQRQTLVALKPIKAKVAKRQSCRCGGRRGNAAWYF